MTIPTRRGLTLGALMLIAVAPLAFAQPAAIDDDERPIAEAYVLDVGKTLREVAAKSIPKTVAIEIIVGPGRKGFGSGAIISADGYILTCAHVTEPGKKLVAVTHDGKRYPFRVVGINSKNDYALGKIEAEGALSFFKLGSSKKVRVRDWVVALGHPGGPYTDLQPAVAVGRVRGKGRKLPIGMGDKFYKNAILTDCPIFGGNSGGPLIDMDGKLVGINGAILLVNKNAYASSIDEIKADLAAMRRGAKVEGDGPMGIWDPRLWQYMQDMQKEIKPEEMEKMYSKSPLMKLVQQLMGQQTRKPRPEVKVSLGARLLPAEGGGLKFRNIEPDGTARVAGIRRDDVLVAIDGMPVRDKRGLRRALLTFAEGDSAPIIVKRGDRQLVKHALFHVRTADRQPFLRYAFNRVGRTISKSCVRVLGGAEAGHGVVVEGGYILTCDHILGDNVREVRVRLASGVGLPAKIIGRDGPLDIALLKLEPKAAATVKAALTPATFAASTDGLKLGDWVLSGATSRGPMLVGSVSALGREVKTPRRVPAMGLFGMMGTPNESPLRPYDLIVQHDTPLVRGQFGSGLFDTEGRLVGLNVSLPHRGSSYAVPVQKIAARLAALREGALVEQPAPWSKAPKMLTLEDMLKQLLDPDQGRRQQPRRPGPNTQVIRGKGYIGIKIDTSDEAASGLGIKVTGVEPGMPAAKAGIQPGDLIIKVGGTRVKSPEDLVSTVSAMTPGTKTTVTVIRGQGLARRSHKLEMTIGTRPGK